MTQQAPKAAEPRQLTVDGKRKMSPVFTNGGQDVVFAVHESPNLVALRILRLKDGSQERLHPTVADHQFDPAFSPDGRFHCFVKSATSPQLVLVIQDSREKTEAIFRPRDSRATARNPSIAPDSKRVIFSLSDLGGQQIASVTMQGQDLRTLTESTGVNGWPAVSPDGRQIAFSSSRHGDLEIYVMNADGSSPLRLTTSPGLDIRPAWSPDGRRIAFTSARDGSYQVYVMHADRSGQQRVTNGQERADYPTWHPDGKHLLIVSERAGKSDLCLVPVPDEGT
jgi:Tol biopolymer transport system component